LKDLFDQEENIGGKSDILRYEVNFVISIYFELLKAYSFRNFFS